MTGENVNFWWKILMQQVCLGNSGELKFTIYISRCFMSKACKAPKQQHFVLFVLILYIPVNNFSVMLGTGLLFLS